MFDRRLFRQARAQSQDLVLTIAFSFAGGLLTIGQAWLLSQVLDQAFLQGASLPAVAPQLGALLALSLLRAGVAFAGDWVAGRMAIEIKSELRSALLTHLARLGPAFTQAERTGELANTVVEGVESLDAYFRQYLPQLVISALVPVSLLVVILRSDPLSALVLALTAPLLPVFMILIGRATEALTQRQYGLLSLLSAHFLDVLQGLTTLKALGQSKPQAEVIRRVSERYRSATMEVLRVAFVSALALELIATISTAIVAVEVGLRLLYGRLPFQEAMFILVLAPEFYLPLRNLGARWHAGAAGSAAAKRIFEVLDTPLPRSSAPSPESLEAAGRTPARLAISLRDVHYSYDGVRHALRGVYLEIEPGTQVALVGPSGAGKSTIAHLLLRFIDPTAGEILVDGQPLRSLVPDSWRRQIAWVPQLPHLLNDTLAANLRLARPDAAADDLARAVHLAHLDDLVASLPHGLETEIGEAGARLSAGQAQRLALARAFLKDAPLLLLDEPTSNVDPSLEAQLVDSTDRLMQGRTVLAIAHRMNTVYRADQIAVVCQGQVIERGTHQQLWQAGGLYRQLLAPYAEAAA